MEISITSTIQKKGEYHVKYIYWEKGTCGCTGKEIVRQFKKLPTNEELIEAI